jgi:hypothetical protein
VFNGTTAFAPAQAVARRKTTTPATSRSLRSRLVADLLLFGDEFGGEEGRPPTSLFKLLRASRHRAKKKAGASAPRNPCEATTACCPIAAPVRRQGRQACLQGSAIRLPPDHIQGHGQSREAHQRLFKVFAIWAVNSRRHVSGHLMHQHFAPAWYSLSCDPPILSCDPPIDITKGSVLH